MVFKHKSSHKKVGVPIEKKKLKDYHFISIPSHGFPWLNPAFVPFKFQGLIVEDRDFEEKVDNEFEEVEDVDV